MNVEFTLLVPAAYLMGSVPSAYLVARFVRGMDIRQYGTGQVGGGNLWRITSWKLGLPVGAFDVAKGLVMVWVAQLMGLSIAQQLIVGLAVIAGHNWPVFLHFSGGRGVGTTLGIIEPLPVILGFSGIPLIIIAKRLTAPRPDGAASISQGQLFLNRLFFDRDIKDRKAWISRAPLEVSSMEQPLEPEGGKGKY